MSGGRGNIKPEDGKPFVKDDPRCYRKGRPKKLPNLDRLLITTLGEKIEGTVAMEWVLKSLLKAAINKGDVRAAEVLMDRAYGKMRQGNDITLDFEHLTEKQLDELITRILNTKK